MCEQMSMVIVSENNDIAVMDKGVDFLICVYMMPFILLYVHVYISVLFVCLYLVISIVYFETPVFKAHLGCDRGLYDIFYCFVYDKNPRRL